MCEACVGKGMAEMESKREGQELRELKMVASTGGLSMVRNVEFAHSWTK